MSVTLPYNIIMVREQIYIVLKVKEKGVREFTHPFFVFYKHLGVS